MFMQIIQAEVGNAEGVRAAMDRWPRDLGPGAEGWLDATYGLTDDGKYIAVVRFESEEAARRNSERPEQAEWWRELSANFAGDVTFHNCRDVTLLAGGGLDEAGFVQILQGHLRDRNDRKRAHELVDASGDLMSRHRPDIMGAMVAIDEDDFFTETVAFTTEAAAREAERAEIAPGVARVIREEMSLLDDPAFVDLHHPSFAAHR
ncbi:hypothetical protein [Amycolatopsis taiwanensis]|uniref:ABM domain-containing protein n=1 Tax=Amycolatopsis taiwanensis TaxID=342230 RepID=A0A9W6VG66_9PSEU|nr:hypothetical protein [Amycolatopsis taiwanensis]GLY65619.1 hypothetical protein Atai01_22380 [Amycolatopsis taiwanensis]